MGWGSGQYDKSGITVSYCLNKGSVSATNALAAGTSGVFAAGIYGASYKLRLEA
ncbi:MAG: hypothetical protein LBI54_08955 [Lachnospiraceae bacterium]|nr:hypothetical protein [Lachnospiraceae bacterium]